MLRNAFIAAALMSVVLISAGLAIAATVRAADLESLIDRSDYVIYGRVLWHHPIWDEATRTIWTITELQVLDGPKGRVGSVVRVTEPGGVLGDIGHMFPGVPKFRTNQEVVLFLYHAPGNRIRVTGIQQGVYLVMTNGATRDRLAQPLVPLREAVYEAGRGHSVQPRQQTGQQRLDDLLFAIRQRAIKR